MGQGQWRPQGPYSRGERWHQQEVRWQLLGWWGRRRMTWGRSLRRGTPRGQIGKGCNKGQMGSGGIGVRWWGWGTRGGKPDRDVVQTGMGFQSGWGSEQGWVPVRGWHTRHGWGYRQEMMRYQIGMMGYQTGMMGFQTGMGCQTWVGFQTWDGGVLDRGWWGARQGVDNNINESPKWHSSLLDFKFFFNFQC